MAREGSRERGTGSNVVSLREAFEAPRAEKGAVRLGDKLHESAYRQIRQALMDGRFAPEQVFTLRSLSEVLGMSLIPVRDALKRLVAEHALELRRNRSVVLPAMSRHRFQEVLHIRLALEPMLAARAAARIDASEIRLMSEDHESMTKAVSRREGHAFLAANRRFHFRLYGAADSPLTLQIVEGLWMQVGPHLHRVLDWETRPIQAADRHHLDLLKAVRRRDANAAARAIHDDLVDAADHILVSDLFDEGAV